jgi:hypothetical protein
LEEIAALKFIQAFKAAPRSVTVVPSESTATGGGRLVDSDGVTEVMESLPEKLGVFLF